MGRARHGWTWSWKNAVPIGSDWGRPFISCTYSHMGTPAAFPLAHWPNPRNAWSRKWLRGPWIHQTNFSEPKHEHLSLLIRHQRCACSQRASFGRMQLKMWKINFPLDLGRGIFRGTSDLRTFFFFYLVHFFFQNPGTGKRGSGEAWKSALGVPKMTFQYKSAIGTIQKELRILHLKCFWSDRKKFGAKIRTFSAKFRIFSDIFG